jgi:hypothetical protein
MKSERAESESTWRQLKIAPSTTEDEAVLGAVFLRYAYMFVDQDSSSVYLGQGRSGALSDQRILPLQESTEEKQYFEPPLQAAVIAARPKVVQEQASVSVSTGSDVIIVSFSTSPSFTTVTNSVTVTGESTATTTEESRRYTQGVVYDEFGPIETFAWPRSKGSRVRSGLGVCSAAVVGLSMMAMFGGLW